jgi:outer membrane protein assembly factor BamB
MANWHGFLSGAAAATLRTGRLAMAVVGAAVAGAAPVADRGRGVRPPRLVWHVPGEGRGTPALDGATAYFLSRQHEVVAVHRRTGKERWRRHTGEPGLTTAGTTLVAAGDVVIAGDYNVVAFERTGGEVRWRFTPRDGYGPGIYLGGLWKDVVFAGSPAGRVYAVDVSSGRPRWSYIVSTDLETTVYPPVVGGDSVAATYMRFPAPGAGGLVLLEAGDGRLRWQAAFPAKTGPASRPAGGPLFVDEWVVAASGDGAIHGFDRSDGALRWTIPPLGGTGIGGWDRDAQDFRALAHTGSFFVAGSLTGLLSAYHVTTRAERWRRASVDASTAFGIAADGNLVYVPHLSGEFVAFDFRDGTVRWRLSRALGFRWPPAVEAHQIYLSGSTSGFFSFTR